MKELIQKFAVAFGLIKANETVAEESVSKEWIEQATASITKAGTDLQTEKDAHKTTTDSLTAATNKATEVATAIEVALEAAGQDKAKASDPVAAIGVLTETLNAWGKRAPLAAEKNSVKVTGDTSHQADGKDLANASSSFDEEKAANEKKFNSQS